MRRRCACSRRVRRRSSPPPPSSVSPRAGRSSAAFPYKTSNPARPVTLVSENTAINSRPLVLSLLASPLHRPPPTATHSIGLLSRRHTHPEPAKTTRRPPRLPRNRGRSPIESRGRRVAHAPVDSPKHAAPSAAGRPRGRAPRALEAPPTAATAPEPPARAVPLPCLGARGRGPRVLRHGRPRWRRAPRVRRYPQQHAKKVRRIAFRSFRGVRSREGG